MGKKRPLNLDLPVSKRTLKELERRAEQRGNAAASRSRSTASPHRCGSREEPYTRRDGVETRQCSIHFPVELHQWLREECARTGESMSSVVTAALEAWRQTARTMVARGLRQRE